MGRGMLGKGGRRLMHWSEEDMGGWVYVAHGQATHLRLAALYKNQNFATHNLCLKIWIVSSTPLHPIYLSLLLRATPP